MMLFRHRTLLDRFLCGYGLLLTVGVGLLLYHEIRNGDFYWRHVGWSEHLGNLNLFLAILTGMGIMLGACTHKRAFARLTLTAAGALLVSVMVMQLWFPPMSPEPGWGAALLALVMVCVLFLWPALLLFHRPSLPT